MITSTHKSKIHWNYFLALEQDLDTVARYIEFSSKNFKVYSIELAKLLLSAASEVDVLAKTLCERFEPARPARNIGHYKSTLTQHIPLLSNETVFVPRYGLKFKPWNNWKPKKFVSPDWWDSYNAVKHHRNTSFQQATLKNVLNAMGALLLLNLYHYRLILAPAIGGPLPMPETHSELQPEAKLLRLKEDYYFFTRVGRH